MPVYSELATQYLHDFIYLLFRVRVAHIGVNHEVSRGHLFFDWQLCGDSLTRLGFTYVITSRQPFKLEIRRTGRYDDVVEVSLSASFKKKRDGSDRK